MSEDETTTAVMGQAEQAIDALVELYEQLLERDQAGGANSDEAALGGVGMRLGELGPHRVVIVAAQAIRRISASRRGSVTA